MILRKTANSLAVFYCYNIYVDKGFVARLSNRRDCYKWNTFFDNPSFIGFSYVYYPFHHFTDHKNTNAIYPVLYQLLQSYVEEIST